jgi:hypothetical protein
MMRKLVNEADEEVVKERIYVHRAKSVICGEFKGGGG